MQEATTFQIYNASAGSGKTFTLVKDYLKILLSEQDMFHFQKVLAITFTNKAAAEMKERVLENLRGFAEGEENIISELLLEETGIDLPTIKQRSKNILHAILQNYSAFNITTIDSFTYRIVKSFAFDLGLTQNFEVEMDSQELLNEAVEVLISRIGTDKDLTKLLIDYTLEKTDDDKSWNIARDLTEFSKILLNENDANYFKKLANKSLDDFKSLKSKLLVSIREIEGEMKSIASRSLKLIDDKGINHKDFYRSMIPNHFKIIMELPSKGKFFDANTLKANIENQNFYSKSKSREIKDSIESVLPQLLRHYYQLEELYKKLVLNKLVLNSIVPLTVLNNINQELSYIKEDNNLRLNSEFNRLISNNIQEQPAPFIYERIGQKFMHYFIDEMQDTSVLQWQNLIPLLDNSLSQEKTSLLIVGDGKQAIYRWRGGKAEQFINLGDRDSKIHNPFCVDKRVSELGTNYRSFTEVVNFNNSLFHYVSKFIQNPLYKDLYEHKSYQKGTDKEGGCVTLSFIEKEDETEEKELRFAKQVLDRIHSLDQDWFRGDVCVLVRKRKEGTTIANYLSENGVDIVSSETLLLSNSSKVNFIIHFLQYVLFSQDRQSLFGLLSFLSNHFKLSESKNCFYKNHIHLSIAEFFESLKNYDVEFDLFQYHQLPLYEKIELIVRSFNLTPEPDAYVQFFLDEVLSQQRKEASVQDLLDFWSRKNESLSIVSSENKNAVKIMTIHKSKGLEFPVVIFPCDLEIRREKDAKAWLKGIDNFPEVLVKLNKEVENLSEEGEFVYRRRQEELELDNFNLLYVALTRPVEQLHIITDKKLNNKGEENLGHYSGIFISYLKETGLWEDGKIQYSFGNPKRVSTKKPSEKINKSLNQFMSTPWQDHNINMLASSSKLWGTQRGEAINYGDLIHEMMSDIYDGSEIEEVITRYIQKGDLDSIDKRTIKLLINDIVHNKKLASYYSENYIVYNEREIISEDGQIYIPDRLALDLSNKIVIIDYKTGAPNVKHRHQLNNYSDVLTDMGYTVEKKILVYIDKRITVEEF